MLADTRQRITMGKAPAQRCGQGGGISLRHQQAVVLVDKASVFVYSANNGRLAQRQALRGFAGDYAPRLRSAAERPTEAQVGSRNIDSDQFIQRYPEAVGIARHTICGAEVLQPLRLLDIAAYEVEVDWQVAQLRGGGNDNVDAMQGQHRAVEQYVEGCLGGFNFFRSFGRRACLHGTYRDDQDFFHRQAELGFVERRMLRGVREYQIGALQAVAALAGHKVTHVKAHGALSNVACEDDMTARAIASAIKAVDRNLKFVVLANSRGSRVTKIVPAWLDYELGREKTDWFRMDEIAVAGSQTTVVSGN